MAKEKNLKLIAASERSERPATLILTGYLCAVWPSKFGHERIASFEFDFWMDWGAIMDSEYNDQQ